MIEQAVVESPLQDQQGEENMAAKRCPYCRVFSNFGSPAVSENRTPPLGVCLEPCQNCGMYVYFEYASPKPPDRIHYVTMYPFGSTDVDEELPEDVVTPFKEALSSVSAKNWNAAVVMCRRALEEAVSEQGATGNNLQAKIEDLAQTGRLTPAIQEWAHQTRLGGNLGAHGSPTKKWADQTDAEEIIEFSRSIFQYVYVLPEQVAQRRKRLSDLPSTGSG